MIATLSSLWLVPVLVAVVVAVAWLEALDNLAVCIDLLVLVMMTRLCFVLHYQIDPACSSKIKQGSVNPSQSI